MTQARYQVEQLGRGAQAWFPTMGTTPMASTHGSIEVHGSPGTSRVVSPKPAGSGNVSGSKAWKSPSDVAPDWFAPQLYVTDIRPSSLPRIAGGVRYFPNDSEIPHPTQDWRRVAKEAMKGRKVGGQRAMKWPRPNIRWPNLMGQYSPSEDE